MSEISLTIPMEGNALFRASEMLKGLAKDLDRESQLIEPETVTSPVVVPIGPSTTAVDDQFVERPAVIMQSVPTTPAPPIPDLDDEDYPWDSRIHGKAKKKLANGTWKLIRGVDPELIKTVRAEYDAIHGSKALNEEEVFEMTKPLLSEQEIAEHDAQTAVQSPAEVVFGAPTEPAEAVQIPAVTMSFPEIMQKITSRLTSNPDFNNMITQTMGEFGIAGLPELVGKPELIPQFDSRLDQLWQG